MSFSVHLLGSLRRRCVDLEVILFFLARRTTERRTCKENARWHTMGEREITDRASNPNSRGNGDNGSSSNTIVYTYQGIKDGVKFGKDFNFTLRKKRFLRGSGTDLPFTNSEKDGHKSRQGHRLPRSFRVSSSSFGRISLNRCAYLARSNHPANWSTLSVSFSLYPPPPLRIVENSYLLEIYIWHVVDASKNPSFEQNDSLFFFYQLIGYYQNGITNFQRS